MKKYEFNCVCPSYGNGVYLMSEQIEPIVNKSTIDNFGKTIYDGFGILNSKYKVLDMCYVTDENYVGLTSKSIQSLVNCVNPNTKYRVHVICDNVSTTGKFQLMLSSARNVEVETIDFNSAKYIPKKLLVNRGDMIKHVSNAALIKFNLCNILGVNEVLYVDGDIVFTNDPITIRRYDIGENYILGCIDDLAFDSIKAWEDFKRRCKQSELFVKSHDEVINSGHPYINSGVMYMNLKKMREDGVS